jgi:ferredoxin--NADP+ reductase
VDLPDPSRPAAAPLAVPGDLPAGKFTCERITWLRRWSDHLFSFRTTRDRGFRFTPGQFARLGVYRDDGRADEGRGPRWAWRAYSMVSADYDEHLEFYSIVVPDGEFTTRLAQLAVGDTLRVEKASYGFLTLDRFQGGLDLWLLASGTGIAPFVSILQDPAAWEKFRRFIVVHSVRRAQELVYRDTIAALDRHPVVGEHLLRDPSRLVYVPVVTREPLAGTLGTRLPQGLADGSLEARAGVRLDHAASRVMICGNPEMVSEVRATLSGRGYTVARRAAPGQIAVENYW